MATGSWLFVGGFVPFFSPTFWIPSVARDFSWWVRLQMCPGVYLPPRGPMPGACTVDNMQNPKCEDTKKGTVEPSWIPCWVYFKLANDIVLSGRSNPMSASSTKHLETLFQWGVSHTYSGRHVRLQNLSWPCSTICFFESMRGILNQPNNYVTFFVMGEPSHSYTMMDTLPCQPLLTTNRFRPLLSIINYALLVNY